jgi:hypothetical protein
MRLGVCLPSSIPVCLVEESIDDCGSGLLRSASHPVLMTSIKVLVSVLAVVYVAVLAGTAVCCFIWRVHVCTGIVVRAAAQLFLVMLGSSWYVIRMPCLHAFWC